MGGSRTPIFRKEKKVFILIRKVYPNVEIDGEKPQFMYHVGIYYSLKLSLVII